MDLEQVGRAAGREDLAVGRQVDGSTGSRRRRRPPPAAGRCPASTSPACARAGSAAVASGAQRRTPARVSGRGVEGDLVGARRRPAPDRAASMIASSVLGHARRSCPRPHGAPRRWSCPAGCRGTGGAAPSSRPLAARRTGTRRRPRTAAVAAQSSASRSRCSERRLPCLVSGLRGVGAAVDLQVELAGPHRRVGVLGLGLLEEGARRLDGDPRGAFEVASTRARPSISRVGPPPPSP